MSSPAVVTEQALIRCADKGERHGAHVVHAACSAGEEEGEMACLSHGVKYQHDGNWRGHVLFGGGGHVIAFWCKRCSRYEIAMRGGVNV